MATLGGMRMLAFLPVWLLCLALTLQAADSAPPTSAKPQVRFLACDINPQNPKDVTIVLSYYDGKSKTGFFPVGAKIPNSTWVLKSFQRKKIPGVAGKEQDASELTLEDSVTRETVVLKLGEGRTPNSGPLR